MTATHDRMDEQRSRWIDRLARTRLVLAVSAVVFAVLWVVGALTVVPALVGFLVIAIAAARHAQCRSPSLTLRRKRRRERSARERGKQVRP
jgi:uncharacterized membrane protein